MKSSFVVEPPPARDGTYDLGGWTHPTLSAAPVQVFYLNRNRLSTTPRHVALEDVWVRETAKDVDRVHDLIGSDEWNDPTNPFNGQILLVRYDSADQYFVADGHHRIVAAVLRGDDKVQAHVFDLSLEDLLGELVYEPQDRISYSKRDGTVAFRDLSPEQVEAIMARAGVQVQWGQF